MNLNLMMNFGMSYKLIYDTTTALKKDRKKILKNRNLALEIKQKLELLSENPNTCFLDIKSLNPKSKNKLRLRIGNYRVIYSLDFGNKIILIHRIALRSEVYRKKNF